MTLEPFVLGSRIELIFSEVHICPTPIYRCNMYSGSHFLIIALLFVHVCSGVVWLKSYSVRISINKPFRRETHACLQSVRVYFMMVSYMGIYTAYIHTYIHTHTHTHIYIYIYTYSYFQVSYLGKYIQIYTHWNSEMVTRFGPMLRPQGHMDQGPLGASKIFHG